MSEKHIDDNLVQEFCGGNPEAFVEIVNRYAERVFNLAYRISRDKIEAEDISQEVFITVYTKVHKFEGKSAFSSWLYRITANSALMRLRKQRLSKVVSVDKDHEEYYENFFTTEKDISSYEKLEIREALQSALNNLPLEYKTIFVMRDVDKFSNEEVAGILGLSVAAVKSRLHRSRLFLRKKLEKFFVEEEKHAPLILQGVTRSKIKESMIM